MKSITILLSTYNGEKYVEEQLNSIANQTIIEKIKVYARDDGSSDSTIDILEKWKSKIDIEIIRGKNEGAAKSFLQLLKIAPQSEYYAFCDQDDVWNKDKMEIAIKYLENERNNQIPIVYYSNAELADENATSLGYNVHAKATINSIERVMVCNPALGCTMVFNRMALELFKELDIINTPMHDKAILLTCILLGKVLYNHKPQLLYRQHANNVMGRKNSIRKRIKQVYRLWIKGDGCSVELQAQDIIRKMDGRISTEDKKKLEYFADYKRNLKYRLMMIFNKSFNTDKIRINISFKIRVLLGLA